MTMSLAWEYRSGIRKGDVNGSLYMAMEYVDGLDLALMRSAENPIHGCETWIAWVLSRCSALDYAHSRVSHQAIFHPLSIAT